jgi:hypothetical protein
MRTKRTFLAGQYSNPLRVISFNAEGWSRGISAEVATEVRCRCDLEMSWGPRRCPGHSSKCTKVLHGIPRDLNVSTFGRGGCLVVHRRPVFGIHRRLRVGNAPAQSGSSIVSQSEPIPTFRSRVRLRDLLEERRQALLCARTYPIGAQRNQLRQIARSLRNLCRNRPSLQHKAVEGTYSLAWRKTMN